MYRTFANMRLTAIVVVWSSVTIMLSRVYEADAACPSFNINYPPMRTLLCPGDTITYTCAITSAFITVTTQWSGSGFTCTPSGLSNNTITLTQGAGQPLNPTVVSCGNLSAVMTNISGTCYTSVLTISTPQYYNGTTVLCNDNFGAVGTDTLNIQLASPPSTPTITSLISTHSDQLTVAWTSVPTATSYSVSINSSSSTPVTIPSSGPLQNTFTGLTSNTVYTVSVVAINCAGNSSAAIATNLTATPQTLPCQLTGGTSCPTMICPNTAVNYTCNVGSFVGNTIWSVPSVGACSGSTLLLAQGPPAMGLSCLTSSSSAMCGPFTATNTPPLTSNMYCLTSTLSVVVTPAMNGLVVSCSSFQTTSPFTTTVIGSASISVVAPPSAPTITSLTSTYSDQLTVTWTSVPTATSYSVSINSSSSTPVTITSSGPLQNTFTGLTNNTVYTVSVVAINCAGNSITATATNQTAQASVSPSIPSYDVTSTSEVSSATYSTSGASSVGAILGTSTSSVVALPTSSITAPTTSSIIATTSSAAPTTSSIIATTSSVAAPTTSSITTPTTSSITTPTTSSITNPTTSSITAPTTSSVIAPTTSSITTPTTSSITNPTTSSITAPTTSSVAAPTTSSVIAPPTSSITTPTTSSITNPTTSSITTQTTSSVTAPPTSSVVAPPTSILAPSSPNNTAIIGGVVGGVLGFLVLLVLFFVIIAILGRSRSGKVILENESRGISPIVELRQLQPVNSRLQPVPISDFPAHVRKLHEGANRGFEEEFTSIATTPLGPYETSALPYNVPRNRFENIYPYDSSRVVLSTIPGVEGSDYINASYVDGYGRQNCYVATQGPLPNTIADFWRMIWEQRYPTIVMLTELIEGGRVKCERYWPQNVNECWDVGHNLRVTLVEQKPFVEYRLKILTVTNTTSPSSTPLRISHYHFTVWPDHGVPADKTCMIQFIKRVRTIHPYSNPTPLVIHCSAGVGRTGTFILLDSMLERMKSESTLNVYQMVCDIRKKRPLLVQADVQYMFIHDALDEYITCGDTSIPVSKMAEAITQLKGPKGNTTGFEASFKLLEDVSQSPAPHSFTDGEADYNLLKNRYRDRLPLNLTRVRLRTKGAKGTDYINATYVDGYKLPKACIATQAPLESTAEDFWRMVVEVQSRVIVMLCNLTEDGMESSYRYWPDAVGKMVEFGKLKVKLLNEEQTEDDYTLRKLELSSDNRSSMSGSTDSSTVMQFHYTHWSEGGKPSNTSILKIMEALIKVQIATSNHTIVVMCNDGIGRTGAFICTYAQLERIKTEAISDVFQFIKSSRLQRPGLVTHLEHYIFCHEVLDSYVQSFGNYSNFQ